jgi:hypothetical protein
MRDVKIALGAGLLLLVVGIGVALARSPMSVAHTNGTPEEEARIAAVDHGATFCQAHELLPRGISAIRLSWFAFAGPRVRLIVYSGGKAITGGERGPGWTSRVVTVPVRPLSHTVADVTVCGSFQMRYETLTVFGKPTPRADAAYDGQKKLGGRMWIEYLRPGTRTWASLVPSILSHMGLGRASSGPGIVLIALAALAAVVVLASSLVLRELP